MRARFCTRCTGQLLPEWGDFKLCPTCREEEAERGRKVRATKKGREHHNAIQRDIYRRHKTKKLARRAEIRLDHKLSQVCIYCTEPATDDSDYCARHLASHRASALAWYHRSKPNPGATLKKRAKRIAKVTRVETRLVGRPAQPVKSDEPRVLHQWERVLRVAKRFDEVTRSDVVDVLNLDEAEAHSVSHILGRLMRKGYLKRIRGGHGSCDTAYVVTEAGRKAA